MIQEILENNYIKFKEDFDTKLYSKLYEKIQNYKKQKSIQDNSSDVPGTDDSGEECN